MKTWVFADRTAKEILRDPITIGFGLGFPVVLLLLLTAIQKNVPVSLFQIETLTPGIAVFGLSFLTLFSATLIARDRSSALFSRLCTSPMTAADFIFGYLAPILPMAMAQTAVCYAAAMALGLPWSWRVPAAILAAAPSAMVFIALGLLCGSVLNEKQVGGVCGALLTNLTAWLSGAWFDLSLLGGTFEKAADCLPFAHGVQLGRLALQGKWDAVHLAWVLGYGLALGGLAIAAFRRKMRR